MRSVLAWFDRAGRYVLAGLLVVFLVIMALLTDDRDEEHS